MLHDNFQVAWTLVRLWTRLDRGISSPNREQQDPLLTSFPR